MKLLFVTPQVPYPPDQGTKLRNFHLIRIAAEAGHEVDLLSFGGAAPPELAAVCRRIVTISPPRPRGPARRALDALRSPLPDLALRLWSPELAAALARLVGEERYDAVQVEGLELSRFLAGARGPKLIFDDHNVEYLLQRRACLTDLRQPRRAHAALYSLVQWRRLKRWEAEVCARVDAVLAVSAADAERLRRLAGRPVHRVENGIDLSNRPYRPPDDHLSPDLLFDGTLSFRPNDDAARWFCRAILPLVRSSWPEARFWAVGRDPSAALVRYNFGDHGVAVTGTVPSTEPYWARAGLYVLPMRMGGGVRFKALEAMARGVPLISTELGVEGTGAVAGRDYLPAERPAEFAAAIERLRADPALRRRLAEQARQVVAALDWAQIAPRLRAVYDELTGTGSPA